MSKAHDGDLSSVLMTPAQAARYAGVTKRTLQRWQAAGYLEVHSRTVGGHGRYTRQCIADAIERRAKARSESVAS